MRSKGAIYVAFGTKAILYAKMSIASLKIYHEDLPVAVISDKKMRGIKHIYAPDEDTGARCAKLNLDLLSPFDQTLYVDADTLIRDKIWVGFEILEDGWDLVITPSLNQYGHDWLWHCPEGDREETAHTWGFVPLVLQAGVIFLKKSARLHSFFAQWRIEWAKYRDKDQGAFLRALCEVPLRIWVLGRCWNSSQGTVISHRMGSLKRR